MSGKDGIMKGIGGSMSFDGEFVTISKTRLTGAKGNKRVHFPRSPASRSSPQPS